MNVNMVSDDSLTEIDDSYFDIYSTKTVTSTYNNLLEKLKSGKNESGNAEIIAERDKEYNVCTLNDSSESSTNSIVEVVSDENDFEFIPDSPDVPTPIVENLPVRRSARLNKRRGKQTSSTDDISIIEVAPSIPVCKRRKRQQKKKKIIPEVVELSDEETHDHNLSLDDELNYEVSVKVLWMSVTVKTFHLRRFQKFKPIFDYFMKEENVPYEKILLQLRGTKITINDTAESLDLKVCDFIDGGILTDSVVPVNKSAPMERSTNDENCLTVKFQDKTKLVHRFTINKDEGLKIIMMKYAEQTEIPLKNIRFCYDGEVLKPGDTPTSLGMENDDIIDVKY